jgi:putative membrane protein
MRRPLMLATAPAAALSMLAALSLLAACDRGSDAPRSAEAATSPPGVEPAPGLAPAADVGAELPPAGSAAGFLERVAIIDQFETQAGQLALQATHNADVRRFAQLMVDDHARIGREGLAVATAQQLNAPAAGRLDAPRQELLDALRDSRAEDFDKRYIEQQIEAHQNALQLLREFADTGDNPALKDWARRTAPAIENHLQMAGALERGPAAGAAGGAVQRP